MKLLYVSQLKAIIYNSENFISLTFHYAFKACGASLYQTTKEMEKLFPYNTDDVVGF